MQTLFRRCIRRGSQRSSEETTISTSKIREVFLSRVLTERRPCHVMYDIINVPLVNTAVRFTEMFVFNILTINKALGFEDIVHRSPTT